MPMETLYITKKLTLINLYGPNNDNPQFFQDIFNFIDLDYYNYKYINDTKAREKVLDIMNKNYLLDPFRENTHNE